jgi:glycosyltransferase involved in cell wall biosynthesis
MVSSVGSLIDRKNQSVVIDAISEIEADKRPYYIIIGSGPNRDMLEQRVINRGIEEYIHFTGHVPEHEDVLSKLKAADVMALPSTDEAFGIAYIEAMACGCPVIGCNNEGPSEFVEDNQTGFLVTPNNPNAVAEKLVYFSQNKDELAKMGENACRYARENFTWTQYAVKVETILNSALDNYFE